MSSTILKLWTKYTSERHPDVIALVREFLVHAQSGIPVSGRVVSAHEVQLDAGHESDIVAGPYVVDLFRMVCARLAVIFGADREDPVRIYGARLQSRVEEIGSDAEFELEFENKPGRSWFRLCQVGDGTR